MGKRRRAREDVILRIMSAERPFRWMTVWMVRDQLPTASAKKWALADMQAMSVRGVLEWAWADEIPGFVDPRPLPPEVARRVCYRVTEEGSRLPAQRELARQQRRGRRFRFVLGWRMS